MDQISLSFGIGLASGTQPTSLQEWNARYEAMSIERDWWFRAAAAAVRWFRSAIGSAARPRTTAELRATHA